MLLFATPCATCVKLQYYTEKKQMTFECNELPQVKAWVR